MGTGRKKARSTVRLKIRWELLGLPDPNLQETVLPIDRIRKEISSLASLGFGEGTRSRLPPPRSAGKSPKTISSRNRRHRNIDKGTIKKTSN